MDVNGLYSFDPYNERGIIELTRLAIYDNQKKKFIHFETIDPYAKYHISHRDLGSHFDFKYKYQVLDDSGKETKWKDHDSGYRFLVPEQINEAGLKYVFYPSLNASKYLIVGFQAIQNTPSYNYIRTLNGINAHRLYIKDDYGLDERTHSSYYLNERNPIDVERLVQLLIDNYVKHLNISKEDIIFIGSSKGGFAGLYHGYKYGVGHIIVGGPQTMLGDYLCVNSKDSIRPAIFEKIFGSSTKKEYANNLMYKVLENSEKPFPNTMIHVGKGEPHYIEHAIPFMKWADKLEISNVKWDFGDYDTHEELAVHYPIFLEKSVKEIINSEVAQ
ncbi:hypothetical protein ACTXJ5_09215 [Psychrobacter alimentarius]|uniref:hypothetical protein n=1 Tax=Psychrobacter alimentarius TaxID=261164 RepID=UPI003FD02DC5